MIVDIHTHIFEDPSKVPYDRGGSAADLLAAMDAAGVTWSVIIPLPAWASNEFVAQTCAEHPDRFVQLYTPEVADPGRTVELMAAFFAAHTGHARPRGIKIHPRVQNVDADSKVVRDVVAWAAERAIPMVFDVFPFGPRVDDPALEPMAYHRLAQAFPKATIILAHAGGYRALEAFMVAKANPNVILDISFTLLYFPDTSVEADLVFACKRLPAGRVMYGSDFPSMGFGEYLARTTALLAAAEIPDDQRRALMGGTAVKIFGLP